MTWNSLFYDFVFLWVNICSSSLPVGRFVTQIKYDQTCFISVTLLGTPAVSWYHNSKTQIYYDPRQIDQKKNL